MTVDFKHDGPKVILAEGKDDCHVMLALRQYHGIPKTFGFYDCGSDKGVLKKMSGLIAGSQPIETICVVLDADNPDLQGKWDSVKGRLEKEDYTVPAIPNPAGTILRDENKPENKPAIGIWLMPDNDLNGMLEDFCGRLAAPAALGYAQNCVHEAKRNGFTTFIDSHKSKAVIHTFLAWQDRPGMPLGLAITAQALNPNQPVAERFVSFLKSLFLNNEPR